MESYSMNSEAGPSTSRITLGPPISPSTNTISLPMEDDEPAHYGSNHSTPKPSNNSLPVTPPRPARSSRRSLDSSIRRSSVSSLQSNTVTHDWSPLRIQASYRRASSSHQSSFSSIHPTPGDENRCRVSFDATPSPPSIAEFSSVAEESNLSRIPSGTSFGQIDQPEEEAVTVRRKNTKKARFVEAPEMTRSDYDTSADSNITRRSYLSAFTGEDDPESYADEFRFPVDEAIRSVPGVVGLGEGWASAPRHRQKKKWFKRGQQVEEDPLSLWNQNHDSNQRSASPPTSPLKGIWSRSKRNLFGQSSPALLGENPSSPETPRSASRLGRLFSLSRPNLVSSTSDPSSSHHRSSINPITTKSKRFSLGMFSTSEITLQQHSNPIPTSPSMPALSIAQPSSPNIRRQRQYSQSILARSEPDLPSVSEAVPRRSSSLKQKQGLPPPWRPSSMIISASARNSMLLVPDQEHGISESSTSLETPMTRGSSTPSLTRGHPLTRTATFGIEDIASEQRIDEENDIPESEGEDEWIQVGNQDQLNNDGNSGNRSSPSVKAPQRRPSMKQRSSTWLKKMKNVLTHSNSQETLSSPSSIGQTVDRLLTRRKTSKAMNASAESTPTSDPTSTVSSVPSSTPDLITGLGGPSTELLKSFPSVPQRKVNKHRRSASWMVRSSSSLAKRLSKLTEQEELDVDHNNGINPGDQFDSSVEAETRRDRRTNSSKHQRSRSSTFSLLGIKSRQNSCVHPLEELEGLPASFSMPALSKLNSRDLNLELNLQGEDLGLDDILDEERRSSIVYSIGQSTPNLSLSLQSPNREQVLKNTFETLSGQKTPIRQPSPDPSYKSKMKLKHNSLPLNTTPYRDSANAKHKRTATVSTINSSPSPSLLTPRYPGEVVTFANALTFSEVTQEENKEILSTGKKSTGKDDTALAGSWKAGGLNVPSIHRNSVSTHRFSMESYLTQPSLYDTEEVIQGHAIRVESIEDMQKQASVISLEELGRNWSGALQMTRV